MGSRRAIAGAGSFMFKDYIKFYFLEDYLFNEVNKNFKRGYLKPEEFFAIVIWKSPRVKTRILKEIKEKHLDICEITKKLNDFTQEKMKEKMKLLDDIKWVGLPIASAILTVCYPKDFTVVDRRAKNSLKNLNIPMKGNPAENIDAYFSYLDFCKKEAKKQNLSLRDFDRALFGKDIYEGEKGLRELVNLYSKTIRR